MVDPAGAVSPVRVFVLDDHEIVRRGLVNLLSGAEGLEVVGEASTAAEALHRIPAVLPDVALLDVMLPDGSGIDVCREIRSRFPQVSCLMLTSYDDDEALFAAVMAGAAGYLTKQIRGAQLVPSIREVAAGGSLLDPALTRRLLDRIRTAAEPAPLDPMLAQLTDREREILELIADGRTNRQIGERLYLAEKTIKNAVSTIFDKLGLQRRTQAAVYADRLRARRPDRP
ncbi:MAG: response regulator transcription factor [Friedmanniella sp.]|nr:response regulator transcription factor [Friedmanniella sp.]